MNERKIPTLRGAQPGLLSARTSRACVTQAANDAAAPTNMPADTTAVIEGGADRTSEGKSQRRIPLARPGGWSNGAKLATLHGITAREVANEVVKRIEATHPRLNNSSDKASLLLDSFAKIV